MPKLIKKNGEYFLRKSHDFAVHPNALHLLKDIKTNSYIDEGFYKYMLSQGHIAVYNSHSSQDSFDNKLNANTESDTLAELLKSIKEIEERYSNYGIEIEVKIKSASAQ